MKSTLFNLLVFIASTSLCYSQSEITVTAPQFSGTITSLRAPNGTDDHTCLRGVMIITAAELSAIPPGTTLTKLNLLIYDGANFGVGYGNIQFYLENTSDVTNSKPTNWASATSTMTSVYSGGYLVPSVPGPTAQLTLTTPFVYTGGSLYIGYDYLGSGFAFSGAQYEANTTISGGWKGDESTTTTPPTFMAQSSSFRPCFQFTYTNPFSNDVNVSGVAGEKGILNNTIQTSQTITSSITNASVGPLTDIPVTLTVAGANPYTVTHTIPLIGAGETDTLLFNNIPAINLGAQTITVSVPNDENNTNNSQVFVQQVQCDTLGYVQTPTQDGSVGFDTGTGILANRHEIPNNIVTYVKSVSNYFPSNGGIIGTSIKGVLLDEAGTIIDSTALITIGSGVLGTKQDYDFINGNIDVSGQTIYVGFRQTVSSLFPFSSQFNSYVDPNAAAEFDPFGGPPSSIGTIWGYVMFDATLAFGGFNVANSSTAGEVCNGSTLTISPTPGYGNYEFFVDGVSVQNGASATHTTTPLTTDVTYSVDITNGGCVLNSNTEPITISNVLVNDISAEICLGDSYTLGGQTITTGGNYSDTLISVGGCDSVVNLSLVEIVPTSSTLNVGICSGDLYQFGSQILSTPGTYTEVIPNAGGCDSTITLNLSVNTPSSSTQNVLTCADAYYFYGQLLTTPGTYIGVIPNAAGCDSTITINITFSPSISVTATVSGTSISAVSSPPAISYQWIDCSTNDTILGETGSTFNPTSNGSYAVIAYNADSCGYTSSCVDVNTIGLDENMLNAVVRVYPNPAVNTINILSTDASIFSYRIVDGAGRLVAQKTLDTQTGECEVLLNALSEGTYLLEINTSKGKVYESFVKK